MPRKYATGRKAWFECGRCGLRGLYRYSMFDGYFPNLRVHPECWEDKHPQENLPKVSDPVALWRPSPEGLDQTPPVLSIDGDGVQFFLTWTEATSISGRIDSYDVYRSVDGGDFVLLVSLPVVYDEFMTLLSQTLEYDDAAVDDTHSYAYYVVAADRHGEGQNSNTVELDTVSLIRFTEDGTARITEDAEAFRVLEA